MDGWVDRWVDRWVDVWVNGWMVGWMDGWGIYLCFKLIRKLISLGETQGERDSKSP